MTHHFETPWTEHAFLEPECAVAMPFDDGVFIYSSDQGIYDTRRETALMLGLPEDKVIVENCFVGGGFGGVLGMFLGVPIFACVSSFVNWFTDRSLEKKGATEALFDPLPLPAKKRTDLPHEGILPRKQRTAPLAPCLRRSPCAFLLFLQ